MATLNDNLKAFAIQVGKDIKAIKLSVKANLDKIGDTTLLTTTNKNNIVAAVNEVKASIITSQRGAITEEAVNQKLATKQDKLTAGTGITISPTNTISATVDLTNYSTKQNVKDEIATAVNKLVDGAEATMDTFKEVQEAIKADKTVTAGLTASVGNKVDYSKPQTLTTAQQKQACDNIGIGDPSVNLVNEYTTVRDAT